MNLHRRDFLYASAAAGLAAALPFPAFAALDPRLASTLDAIAWDVLRESPETLSLLGLDTGAHAAARGKLTDRSAAARARTVAGIARHRRMLAAVDRNALRGHDRLVYDSTDYLLKNAAAGTRFPYGGLGDFGGGNPYVISQQDGAYQGIPEFLDSVHRVENRADAEAYLARLAAFAVALDQETEQARHDAGLGVIPPDFILDTALGQRRAPRAPPPAKARLVTSLTRRTSEHGIPGNWAARAEAIVTRSVYPALDRQIAALARNRTRARPEAG